MDISRSFFGNTAAGEPVSLYTLRNSCGAEAGILDLGAAVQSLRVPAPGGIRDVILGYDDAASYENQDSYMGVTVGRVANRIAGACISLGEETFRLTANEGSKCHHGGVPGFGKRMWTRKEDADRLILTYHSPDGESGFPGSLDVSASFLLTEGNALEIEYSAVSDRDTPISLTSHCYFNLLGHDAGTLKGHTLRIHADKALQLDDQLVPNGVFDHVAGSDQDFLEMRPLIADPDHPHDLNFVIGTAPWTPLRIVASAAADGLQMDCLTTQPGLQLYTADALEPTPGKGGTVYQTFGAFCLEAQNWPDAVHHSDFPTCILRAGETYQQKIVYQFHAIP